jgi:hypothetical protein
MKAKGTIRDSLVWTESRRYFYNRLRRRLAEEDALKRLSAADPSLTREERLEIVHQSIASQELDFNNDAAVTAAIEKGKGAIASRVKETRAVAIGDSIAAMADEDHDGVVVGIKRLLADRLGSDDMAVSARTQHPPESSAADCPFLSSPLCHRRSLVCYLPRIHTHRCVLFSFSLSLVHSCAAILFIFTVISLVYSLSLQVSRFLASTGIQLSLFVPHAIVESKC